MRVLIILLISLNCWSAEGSFADGVKAGRSLGVLSGAVSQAELLRELVPAITDEKLKGPLQSMFVESLARYFDAFSNAEAAQKKYKLIEPVIWTEDILRTRGKFIAAAKQLDLSTIRHQGAKTTIEAALAADAAE